MRERLLVATENKQKKAEASRNHPHGIDSKVGYRKENRLEGRIEKIGTDHNKSRSDEEQVGSQTRAKRGR